MANYDLNMNGQFINNCLDPALAQDVATKSYVDKRAVEYTAEGQIQYAGPSPYLPTILPVGASGDVLTVAGGVPTWAAPTGGVTYWSQDISSNVYLTDITKYVGIGTTAPICPLHVQSYDTGSTFVYSKGYIGVDTTTMFNAYGPGDNNPVGCSIYGANGIFAGYTYSMASDKRIKQNIRELNIDDEYLKIILRLVKPVKYDYIDKKLPTNYYGFIAQDVKKVLPNSVSKIKNYIENFSCFIEIKNDITDKNIFISSFHNIDNCPNKPINFYPNHDKYGNEYKTTDGFPASDVDGNQHFLIKLINTLNNNVHEVYTLKIINDKQFLIDSTYEKNKKTNISEGIYYLVGQQVDDFLVFSDSELIPILTACVKKIEKEQQHDKARIFELETKVDEQQCIINNIIDRLNKIGA